MIVQSMGMGVQSVTLSAMACLGDLPMPAFAVFADTGWELEETYEYARWFEIWARDRGLKIITASKGNIRTDAFKRDGRWASMPLYVMGEEGRAVPLLRQCSKEYKIAVVQKAIRDELRVESARQLKEIVTIWLGYSLDEVERMKEPSAKWYVNEYPLIDKRMSRGDCERYLKAHGLAVPAKSACVGCPWRSDASWASMKRHRPDQFADACKFDAAIRYARPGIDQAAYLHKSLVPLSEAYLGEDQGDMFINECEGPCAT